MRPIRSFAALAILTLFPFGIGGARAADPSAERTLVVAIELDRDGARLLGFAVKERPFVAPRETSAASYVEGGPAQFEVTLLGPGGARFTQRVSVAGLCLAHGPDVPAEIAGDTIRLHRESFLVEEPELAGFDHVEVAYSTEWETARSRNVLGTFPLGKTPQPPLTQGSIHFPEEFGDTDIFTVFGNQTETGKRINIVIVPDGYTYPQKATMQAHAQALVAAARARSPYKEHDRFINYILVYAYSTQDGTDQCDCSIVRDTAMSTHFAGSPTTCGEPGNRCLYYSGGCDTDTSEHIAATELRAPARDKTILMVNTTRFGGCGGERAAYSAANSSGTEIALHELGHTVAGLVDEYANNPSCGGGGGVNASMDPVEGSWPEWIADLGAPREGALFYEHCIYRPAADCAMRTLGVPFCPVCAQQWALTFFGHPRVSPTAPIESATPASPVYTDRVTPETFSLETRLASGPGVTNEITWQLQGPGFPTATTVATDTLEHTRTFPQAGRYTLTGRVVADTHLVKPAKNGPNFDIASWTVSVCEPAGLYPASNNGPICSGNTLQLSAPTLASASYLWSGPGGFHATEQNPVIPNAGASSSGTYDVTIATHGCEFNDTTTATVIPDGSSCNDGNGCTQTDTCQAGVCTGPSPVVCTASDSCHVAGTCNPSTGTCSNPPAANGTSCSDGNACTQTDSCQEGVCTGASSVVCTASDPCHVAGTCNPATGICSNPPKDVDGDGHREPLCGGDDCNDASSQVWLAPVEVIRLNAFGRFPTLLAWDDQRAAVGPGTIYDLVSAKLFRGDVFDYATATCVSIAAAASYLDSRPKLTAGWMIWYLVRARNSCGQGTYGSAAADSGVVPCF